MNGPITTEETYHVSSILKHYAHAKAKHPYFCDKVAKSEEALRKALTRFNYGVDPLAAGVPVFVKQICLPNGKFTNKIEEFPAHLRIRQVPWAKEGEDK